MVNTMLEADDRSCETSNNKAKKCFGIRERCTLLPNDSVAQRGRGRTPQVLKQPSDAVVKLKAVGGKNMSPPRPDEKGCVISVHHCQSQFPAQLEDSRGREGRAGAGRMRRKKESEGEEEEKGGLK